jgi:hypothetical protein
MRIVWAGPWNERSSVAEFGAAIVGELMARGHDVQVLRTEVGWAAKLRARRSAAHFRTWKDAPLAELAQNTDVIVVNFGDDYLLHGAMLRDFAKFGVVGIFHDRVLMRLAEGWARTSPDVAIMLRRLVKPADSARVPGDTASSGRASAAYAGSMLEWCASGVVGAAVTGERSAQQVRAVCPGPVATIQLAYQLQRLPPPRRMSASRLTVASFASGDVTARMDQVIMAIGGTAQLRGRCRFRVIGDVASQERDRLQHLAASLQMAPLQFTGWVPAEALRTTLSNVDLFACLDDQQSPEDSSSLLLCMQSGRPTMLTAGTALAALPEGLVLPCAPGNEAADVARHMTWVLSNPRDADSIAQRAQAYARQTHSAQAYVDALVPLLESAIASRPTTLAGRALGKTLAEFGVEPGDPATTRLGAAVDELFGP